MTTKAKCINITDGVQCTKQASWNYLNEPPRYCSNHTESRIINGKIQRMANRSKNTCSVDLCSKDISKYSHYLCSFHYTIKLSKLENLLKINNLKDLDKLKKTYNMRSERLIQINTIGDIKQTTAGHITKFK